MEVVIVIGFHNIVLSWFTSSMLAHLCSTANDSPREEMKRVNGWNRGRVEIVKGVNRQCVLIPKPEGNPEYLKSVHWLAFKKATEVER